MAPTNVILNGGFTASTNNSAANWSGTDIETRASSVYISGSGNSRVAELNGGTGATTVMQQSFTLTDPSEAELSLDFALRDSATVNVDGFLVEILDSGNNVIASQSVLPTVLSVYSQLTMDVDFPSAGTYTLRFTEIGDNADGSGAIIDNVALIICFGGNTEIATPNGSSRASDLKVGQLVETLNGPKPIRWIGRRSVFADDTAKDDRYCPVRICAGALGIGFPKRDLLVSRQHRMMVQSRIAERMFGTSEVLLPAIRLTELPGIFVDTSVREIEYIHILLDDHEVVFAEGAPSETLLLGQQALKALSKPALEEIELIFPGLLAGEGEYEPARPIVERRKQRKIVTRIAKNDRWPLEELRSA